MRSGACRGRFGHDVSPARREPSPLRCAARPVAALVSFPSLPRRLPVVEEEVHGLIGRVVHGGGHDPAVVEVPGHLRARSSGCVGVPAGQVHAGLRLPVVRVHVGLVRRSSPHELRWIEPVKTSRWFPYPSNTSISADRHVGCGHAVAATSDWSRERSREARRRALSRHACPAHARLEVALPERLGVRLPARLGRHGHIRISVGARRTGCRTPSSAYWVPSGGVGSHH